MYTRDDRAGSYLIFDPLQVYPTVRLICSIPSQIQQRGLSLAFTAWGECSSACGPGLSLRQSYCEDSYGNLADPTGCQAYNSMLLPLLIFGPRSMQQMPGVAIRHIAQYAIAPYCTKICRLQNARLPITSSDGMTGQSP